MSLSRPRRRSPRAFEPTVARFEAQYESLFGAGSAFREAGLEVLNVRVLLTAHLEPSAPSRTDRRARRSRDSVGRVRRPVRPAGMPRLAHRLPRRGHASDRPGTGRLPGADAGDPPGSHGATPTEFGNFVVRYEMPAACANHGDTEMTETAIHPVVYEVVRNRLLERHRGDADRSAKRVRLARR